MERLAQQAKAFQLYADDHDDRLPLKEVWMDSIKGYSARVTGFPLDRLRPDRLFHCPSVPGGYYGYAMNAALSGSPPEWGRTKPNPPVLVYDSAKLDWNAFEAIPTRPTPPRHGGVANVLFLDGHTLAFGPGKGPFKK